MDLERTMTFIVKQPAKFETDIARINEIPDRHTMSIGALVEASRMQNEQAGRNNEALRGLIEVSRLQGGRVDGLEQSLSQSHGRWTHAQEETADAHNRLARAKEEVDLRLRIFSPRFRGPLPVAMAGHPIRAHLGPNKPASLLAVSSLK